MTQRDDGAPAGVAGWHEIQVDIDSLRQLAEALRSELDDNVRPRASELVARYRTGVGFGHGLPGDDLRRAHQAYRDCLAAAMTQLDALIDGAGALADAADRIATRYGSVDALAEGRASAVEQALDVAARARAAVPPDDPRTGTPRTGYR
jgi:hypothetical protein